MTATGPQVQERPEALAHRRTHTMAVLGLGEHRRALRPARSPRSTPGQDDPGAVLAAPDRRTVPTAARPSGGPMDAHQIVAGLGGADDILEIASRVEDLLG